MLIGRASSYYRLVGSMFATAGLAVKRRFEVDTVEMAKKCVEKGLGVYCFHA